MTTDRTAALGERVMQIGLGFWASRTLLAAMELGVFSVIGEQRLTLEELRQKLSLHPRGAADFMDALVTMGFVERDAEERYHLLEEQRRVLDKQSRMYLGGMLEMSGARLYNIWGNLTEALRTGEAQSEARGGNDFFAQLAQEGKIPDFMRAMSALSTPSIEQLAQRLPWQQYRTFVDVGSAQGALCVRVAEAHPHLQGTGFDLPFSREAFEAFTGKSTARDRLRSQPGNFHEDELPRADVHVFGHILDGCDLSERERLFANSFRNLNPGGMLVTYEAQIDDQRRTNLHGLMMSLNMLLETPKGSLYTTAQARAWMTAAGFKDVRTEHLAGPESMTLGFKPA